MKNHKKYFTLFELLLVVTVLFLGSSLFGFFISKAKRDAKAAVCAKNLFAMGKATNQYANDHKGFLPYAGVGHNNWKLQIAPYLGIKNPTLKEDAKKFAIFHCPSDNNKLPTYMAKDPFYLGKISYTANLFAIDANFNDLNNDSFISTRKLTSIDGPDTVILYAENHAKNNSIGSNLSVNWNRKGAFEYPQAAQKGYHQGRNNYLLLDGGVEFYTYRDTNYPEDLWLLKHGTTDL
jgi:prepilin-type processing-associated H-X9-DG protein